MVRALRAVSAVFSAPAGLDGEQCRHLDFVRVEELAVGGLRLEQELIERQLKERQDFALRPVVPQVIGRFLRVWR